MSFAADISRIKGVSWKTRKPPKSTNTLAWTFYFSSRGRDVAFLPLTPILLCCMPNDLNLFSWDGMKHLPGAWLCRSAVREFWPYCRNFDEKKSSSDFLVDYAHIWPNFYQLCRYTSRDNKCVSFYKKLCCQYFIINLDQQKGRSLATA